MSTCRLHPTGARPDPALLEQCRARPASILSDSQERAGGLRGLHWVPGGRRPRVAGPALPVRNRPGDDLVVHRALDLALPVLALGIDHLGPYQDGPGEIHGPVQAGGAVLRSGDIVVGDGDGVVVLAHERAAEVVE